jgi:CRP-like cAMP-binding protein
MNFPGTPSIVVQNRILACMAPEIFDHLRPYLQPIVLRRRAILQEHNRLIEHIYFIERGVASLFARTQRDGPVEVSIVGRLGFVGVAAVLGTMRSPNRCLMEVPGEALRITAKNLRRVMEDTPGVRQHLLNYVHALLIQNTQTALCNVRHELEERLCRWLLLASDRLDEKTIPLTHDQLSMILGVRRAGVTTTLANLEEAGAVIKTRGAVEIADRAILKKKTCECYRIIASEYNRITGSGCYPHTIETALSAVGRPRKSVVSRTTL